MFNPSPGQVVFQLGYLPGFTGPAGYLGARPSVTVYGNGDAYLIAAGEGTDPGAVMKGTVPVAALGDLVRDAHSSGLFDGADYGTVPIVDAGGTRFTFRPDRAAAHTVTVQALDIDDEDDTLTWLQRTHRQALRRLEQRLRDSVVNPTAWLPSRIDVTAVSDGTSDASTPVRPWPGTPLDALLTVHPRGRCGVLAGPDARRVYHAARRHGPTRWLDSGTTFTLVIRALLPGEPGCAN